MKKIYFLITLFLYDGAYVYSTHHNTQQNIFQINLDTTIDHVTKKWQLTSLEPFIYPSVFSNYIARAYSQKHEGLVVLKISESNQESKALQHLQSDGIVKLLDCDDEYNALLLEYIPSQICLIDFLTTHHDDWIINVFIELFRKIHASSKPTTTREFKSIHDTFSILQTHHFKKIPQNLIKKAIDKLDELTTMHKPFYLLHCDLHCRNILQSQGSFIAIDPLAIVGPLEYEAASFVSSPTDFLLAQHNVHEILQNRINKLSEHLNLHHKQLKDCSFLRVIFLACLCEIKNKNDDWIEQFVQIAEIIDQLE